MSGAAIAWGALAGLGLLVIFAALAYGVADLIEGFCYDDTDQS